MTENRLPPPSSPIPLSAAVRDDEGRQLKKLIDLGRTEPSASPTAAALFFVNKACPARAATLHVRPVRAALGYRPINALTPQDAFPLPSILELMSLVLGHQFYVEFDIDSALHVAP